MKRSTKLERKTPLRPGKPLRSRKRLKPVNRERAAKMDARNFHHREAGEAEISQRAAFEQRYGLDLRAEADRIALEHPRPLGIRGLADRFAAGHGIPWSTDDDLDTYESCALLGWVRREMAREVERRATACSRALARSESVVCMRNVNEGPPCDACGYDGLDENDREALAHHVAQLLVGPFTADPHGEHGLAWSLCEAAGWPS